MDYKYYFHKKDLSIFLISNNLFIKDIKLSIVILKFFKKSGLANILSGFFGIHHYYMD